MTTAGRAREMRLPLLSKLALEERGCFMHGFDNETIDA